MHTTTAAATSASPVPSKRPSTARSESKTTRIQRNERQPVQTEIPFQVMEPPAPPSWSDLKSDAFAICRESFHAKDIGRAALDLIEQLIVCSCEDGYSIASTKTLSERLGYEDTEGRNVRVGLAKLAEKGLIWREQRGNGLTARTYILPLFPQCPVTFSDTTPPPAEPEEIPDPSIFAWAFFTLTAHCAKTLDTSEPEGPFFEPSSPDHLIPPARIKESDPLIGSLIPRVNASVIESTPTTTRLVVVNRSDVKCQTNTIEESTTPATLESSAPRLVPESRFSGFELEALRLMQAFVVVDARRVAIRLKEHGNLNPSYVAALIAYCLDQKNLRETAQHLFHSLASTGFTVPKKYWKRAAAAAPPPLSPAAAPPTSPHADLWSRVLDELRVGVSPGEYATWLAPSALLDIDDELAIIGVPNIFARERLEGHYLDQITRTLQASAGAPVLVRVVLETSLGGAA